AMGRYCLRAPSSATAGAPSEGSRVTVHRSTLAVLFWLVLSQQPALHAQGLITTVAGGPLGFQAGPALSAPLEQVEGIAVDAAGNLFVADSRNHLVVKISPEGLLTVIAGNGIRGFSGEGGPATSASLWDPGGVAVDAQGNVYIADRSNHRVRRINASGTI